MRLHLADVLRDVLERLHRCRADLHRGHRSAAGDHDVEPYHVGEAVVQRQDDERAVVRRNVDARERLFDVGRIVAVRQHDAFRVGRRARRIGDRGVVVVADRLSAPHEFLAVLRQVVAAQPLERPEGRLARLEREVSEDDDVLDSGQFLPDAPDFGQLVFRNEQRPDLGVPQAEEQVVRLLELHRERHADRSGVEEPQLGDDPGIAAFGQNGHLVLRADAERGQSCPDLDRLLAGFGVGRRFEFAVTLLEQEGLGSVLRDGVFEQVDDGLLHVLFLW